jgi:phospho-N-acetylmuramoyl-pentapeptide-transferase
LIYLFYQGLILRMAGAAVVSFLIVLMLGPRMIRFLMKRKMGDRPEFDHADLNELTRHKANTPTMGGILIVIAVFLSILLFANTHNGYIRRSFVALLWLGALGACDDWLKLRQARTQGTGREGLRMWQKLIFQVGLAVLLARFTYDYGRESVIDGVNPAHSLFLPFRIPPVPLGILAYTIIMVLTTVGASNAVNLTDGMDGLAAGCLIIVSLVLLLLAEIVGVQVWANFFGLPLVAGSAEMTVVCAALIGSCLGFLWYNAPPAQVFMGDTGSLTLGGLLGYIAVVTRQEVVLLIAGGVFVMEAGSVLLQVSYFKLTKPTGGLQGKRLFRCAPLHHHFHLGGWAESKVVVRFWLLGIIFAALALATLKLR